MSVNPCLESCNQHTAAAAAAAAAHAVHLFCHAEPSLSGPPLRRQNRSTGVAAEGVAAAAADRKFSITPFNSSTYSDHRDDEARHLAGQAAVHPAGGERVVAEVRRPRPRLPSLPVPAASPPCQPRSPAMRRCRLKQQVQQAVQQGPAAAGVFGAAGGSGSATASPVKPPQDGQQQAAQPQQQQQQQQQYLRLPVESAKKLRWFDREDINMLMQVRLRRVLAARRRQRSSPAASAPVPLQLLPASRMPLHRISPTPRTTPSATLCHPPCPSLPTAAPAREARAV